jgi:hypothetical protein
MYITIQPHATLPSIPLRDFMIHLSALSAILLEIAVADSHVFASRVSSSMFYLLALFYYHRN